MKRIFSYKQLFVFSLALVCFASNLEAQTKKIKRPKSRVGISSVDSFVQESFDLYDKVYKYDGYAEAGTPLEDEDLDVLEDALDEVTALSESAPDILSDLDGTGALKQAKATLQINKAKKALKYSITTAKKLLVGSKNGDSEDADDSEEKTSDNEETSSDYDEDEDNDVEEVKNPNVSEGLEVYSKFDFVPGDKLLFFDDFSQDFIGDFPSKWNTNGTGEVVNFNKVEGKWFELKSGYGLYYVPDLKELPEDFTIEFDLLTSGLSTSTSSSSRFSIYLSDNAKFNDGNSNYIEVSIPLGQYAAFPFRVKNFFNNKVGDVNSDIQADIRTEILNRPHVSIAVTKQRYRLWINEVKYIDIPRLVEETNILDFIKFHINHFKDGEERVFISNLKVAEGGEDLRRKLLAEGKISTNGILFDSGSANIQPQSLGIVRQISQVLMQDENIKLKIVGHTDADGNDANNLKLSKARAEAVKNALVNIYKISAKRLTTDGKGESEPVGDNSTADGKAQNRRVEFIKI